jgi:hypothetical protein
MNDSYKSERVVNLDRGRSLVFRFSHRVARLESSDRLPAHNNYKFVSVHDRIAQSSIKRLKFVVGPKV